MDDQQLVGQILAGDLRAFQTLVDRYEQLVLHMIHRLLQQPQDVEDVCQEVFLRIYQRLPSYRAEAKLSTWIASIAYRTAINYLKAQRRQPLHRSLDEVPEVDWLSAATQEVVEQQDWQSFLEGLIGRLPLHYRTILTLYHLQELSYQEIGQVTDLPKGTVKNYLFRARKLLLAALVS